MIKLLGLRILRLGGAKASTNGNDDGNAVEIDERLYFKP